MSEVSKTKILISAYACDPERGSEAAVGWNWALQMSRYYRVYLVTRRSRKKAIERYLKDHPQENLTFVYVDYPDWVIRFKRGSVAMNFYYLAWQGLAFFKARRLVQTEGIKLAHHVSFMSFTRGFFVPFLGVKSIVGPVGGLQTVPGAGQKLIKNRWVEAARNGGAKFFRFNPLAAIPTYLADRIVLATGANAQYLPEPVRAKTTIGLQIGTEPMPVRVFPAITGPIIFRWIGRMVDHKGFEILIDVLAQLKTECPKDYERVKILVSGSGPELKNYRQVIQKKGLDDAFEFLGWLSLEEMNEVWNRCHAFLFTSLRETTGLSLLEAMTRGVPPIVIDSGGPSEIVTHDCGVKISANSYEELVGCYREALSRFLAEPESLDAMGARARQRAMAHYSWDAVGQQMKEIYQGLLEPPN